MNEKELFERVKSFKSETQFALQTIYDALNQGQQKKIIKDETVKKLFDQYGVVYKK